jgi:hypothetical protein
MKKLLWATLVAMCAAGPLIAKPWRGITPLRSTRLDVEHLLGAPMDGANHWATYKTETETVSILYSNGLPCGAGANSEWSVPEWIVVSITVAPKTITLFPAVNIDQSKYRVRLDPHRLNGSEYLNEKEGELAYVVNGEVSSFRYWAESGDDKLKCSKNDPPRL